MSLDISSLRRTLGYYRPLFTARGKICQCIFRLKPDNSIAFDTLLWLVTDERSEDMSQSATVRRHYYC